jgi:very-short-patch-repair endonuclease
LTDAIINISLRDFLGESFSSIQEIWSRDKPKSLVDNIEAEDLEEWVIQMRKATSLDGLRRREIQELVKKKIRAEFVAQIARFYELFAISQSPLESAFLVGLFASHNAWPELLNPKFLETQYEIGTYRLDFALFPKNNSKIAIELDGHTYHERTEDQAVHDRARDRFLQENGWSTLRFHRKEIEENLDRCIDQVNRIIQQNSSTPPSQISKPF